MGIFGFFKRKKESEDDSGNFEETLDSNVEEDLGDNDFKPAFENDFDKRRLHEEFRPDILNRQLPIENRQDNSEIIKRLDEVKDKLEEIDKRLEFIEKVAKENQ